MRILTIAAHPDDEVLGAGGTIKKFKIEQNCEVFCLILAEGLTSRGDVRDDIQRSEIQKLRESTIRAADIIGYNSVDFGDFPDNRMDSVDLLDVVKFISKFIVKYKPDILLTHHGSDLNIDHRITFQAVITAARPLKESPVRKIMTFETPSATEWHFPYHKNVFSPNVFVDITHTIESKLSAMRCYVTENRPAPHPRSTEKLRANAARWGSVIGCEYSEAFELIYDIL